MREALLAASFDRPAGGGTRLMERYHTAPLKIAKAFPFDHGQLGVYMMDVSPGMMDSDHYRMNWNLKPESTVFLTNQSFTKVHPSHTSPSVLQQTIIIEEKASLEYFPEPITLYKDAHYVGSTEVRMGAGASLAMAEIICPGRSLRGELFQYRLYDNRLTVSYKDELIYYNRQRMEPGEQSLQLPGLFAEHTHYGSFFVFSDKIQPCHAGQLRDALKDWSHLRFGVSLTYKYGLAVNVLGSRAWELQSFLSAVWASVRQILFGLPPLPVRK